MPVGTRRSRQGSQTPGETQLQKPDTGGQGHPSLQPLPPHFPKQDGQSVSPGTRALLETPARKAWRTRVRKEQRPRAKLSARAGQECALLARTPGPEWATGPPPHPPLLSRSPPLGPAPQKTHLPAPPGPSIGSNLGSLTAAPQLVGGACFTAGESGPPPHLGASQGRQEGSPSSGPQHPAPAALHWCPLCAPSLPPLSEAAAAARSPQQLTGSGLHALPPSSHLILTPILSPGSIIISLGFRKLKVRMLRGSVR